MKNKLFIKNALISVSNKDKIASFAKNIEQNNINIFSSGGTAKFLKESNVKVMDVESITDFPEILEGRVKTLHPKIHGGILANRKNTNHLNTLNKYKIPEIDLVVVNLYPFEKIISKESDFDEIIENIDIGGSALIRAAAKNFQNIIVVTQINDYQKIINYIKDNTIIPFEFRRTLAKKAFELTAKYDQIIYNWFNKDTVFPKQMGFVSKKLKELRYGENPHQKAALYSDNSQIKLILNAEQIQGKELSYNNINDSDAAIKLIKEFNRPAIAIIKHTNPCGVAVNSNILKAFDLALAADPISAFGGIIALNQTINKELAIKLSELFVEVIIAPSIKCEAKNILSKKKNTRVLITKKFKKSSKNILEFKSVIGGFLTQEIDNKLIKKSDLEIVSKKQPTSEQIDNMIIGAKIVKHVKSNAIVIIKNLSTIGIGSGQTSRVDACKIAIEKANRIEQINNLNLITNNSIAASDAFFPFADGVNKLINSGIKAIIQPGGSKNDKEIIQVIDEAKICMAFTNVRNFNH